MKKLLKKLNYLTVLNEFKLKSKNLKLFCSLKVPGGIEVIPFRLKSRI